MSLKRDVRRLGATFDGLTPIQRDRIVGGLAEFSALLGRFRPTLEAIGQDISAALPPDDAAKLGRALKDVGVSLVLSFARACAFGEPDAAGSVVFKKIADAVADLPVSTSAVFRPLLSPWEG